ncbi:MAG TPA: methyltransferase domain-containing protein [Alphaproteobacteria bacterium]|nr:methyltransferase domain-containing protein [Alphaproteobacteria bacterium]
MAQDESAERQRRHYDRIAETYAANLGYPHTQEYMRYLDHEFLSLLPRGPLGVVVELCCGSGVAYALVADRVGEAVGLDISYEMLKQARRRHPKLHVVQGDAIRLPMRDSFADAVLIHGGIHHVPDRVGLFREISRILKLGGRLYFYEPVDDFWLWRAIRKVVYRLSPALDHQTEEPLRKDRTFAQLAEAGLRPLAWNARGLIGFCLFMNSDILIVNRVFRFIPGIRSITRAACLLDDWMIRRKSLQGCGLIALGSAERV